MSATVTRPQCDTCSDTRRVPWMSENDPNCYQEPDSDGTLPCPDCTPRTQVVDNVVRPTVWQENADMAASRDRVAQADLVLDVAVKNAIAQIRGGRPGYAHFQLARAQERARAGSSARPTGRPLLGVPDERRPAA